MNSYAEHQIYLFFLILVRTTSMFLSAPIFNDRSIPVMYKIGFGGLMALILFPTVEMTNPTLAFNHISAIILIFQEIVSGVIIGFTMSLLFAGVALAGEYLGLDMGFTMAQVFDPTNNQMMSVITRLKNIAAILFFLLLEGHHFLIQAIAYSFEVLPIGGFRLSGLGMQKLMVLTAKVFVIGVKIAAPAMVALFLTSVAMGIIARAVPQMNIFFVGFPIRIAVGLTFFAFGIPVFVYVFRMLLGQFQEDIIYLLKAF
jgi:flagellar biosynthetic protein FliR